MDAEIAPDTLAVPPCADVANRTCNPIELHGHYCYKHRCRCAAGCGRRRKVSPVCRSGHATRCSTCATPAPACPIVLSGDQDAHGIDVLFETQDADGNPVLDADGRPVVGCLLPGPHTCPRGEIMRVPGDEESKTHAPDYRIAVACCRKRSTPGGESDGEAAAAAAEAAEAEAARR